GFDAQGGGQLVTRVVLLAQLQGWQRLAAGAKVSKKGLHPRRRQIGDDREAAVLEYATDAENLELDLLASYPFGRQICCKITEMLCKGPLPVILERVGETCLLPLRSPDQLREHGLRGHLVKTKWHPAFPTGPIRVPAIPLAGFSFDGPI